MPTPVMYNPVAGSGLLVCVFVSPHGVFLHYLLGLGWVVKATISTPLTCLSVYLERAAL